jgi:hypothetical protein
MGKDGNDEASDEVLACALRTTWSLRVKKNTKTMKKKKSSRHG